MAISSSTQGVTNHLIEKSGMNSSDNTNNNTIDDSTSNRNEYTDGDNNRDNHNNDSNDDYDGHDEEMRIWLQKVINISKNDPNWMDMTPDSVTATVFAAKYLVQSLTKESSLIASYRQSPSPTLLDENGVVQKLEGKQDQLLLQLNYNDIADCISIKDQFSFLSDMIPKTKSLRELVAENKIRYTTFITPEETNQANVVQIDLNNSNDNDDTEDENDE